MSKCSCFKESPLPRSLKCVKCMKSSLCFLHSLRFWNTGPLTNRIRSESWRLSLSKKLEKYWPKTKTKPTSCHWSSKLQRTSLGESESVYQGISPSSPPTLVRRLQIWVWSRHLETCWRILKLMSRFKRSNIWVNSPKSSHPKESTSLSRKLSPSERINWPLSDHTLGEPSPTFCHTFQKIKSTKPFSHWSRIFWKTTAKKSEREESTQRPNWLKFWVLKFWVPWK